MKNFFLVIVAVLVCVCILYTGCITQSPEPTQSVSTIAETTVSATSNKSSTTYPTTQIVTNTSLIHVTNSTVVPTISPSPLPSGGINLNLSGISTDTKVIINNTEMNWQGMEHNLTSDYQFILIDLCVKNEANQLGDRQYYSLTLQDSNNKKYFQYVLGPRDAFNITSIPLGETKCGKAAFVVPAWHTNAIQYNLFIEHRRL